MITIYRIWISGFRQRVKMYNELVKELEDMMEEDKETFQRKGKLRINENQVDVEKLPVIGHIVTREQGPYISSTKYDVVQIKTMKAGDIIYVTNQWYDKSKKVPQLVPAMFVKQYTPVDNKNEQQEDDDYDAHRLEQNKPAPVVFGLG